MLSLHPDPFQHNKILNLPHRQVDAFLDALTDSALNHRAVHHPYLRSLRHCDLPDLQWALADFAHQYSGYSIHFQRYLTLVISLLTNASHRSILLENLNEEAGVYDIRELATLERAGISAEWIEGVPHPELFRRFGVACGVEPNHPEALEVICWREMFMQVLSSGPAQAIGALGLGTETIVSTVYRNFLPALAKLQIPPREGVFFPLHTLVDDQHQAALLEIARHYAVTANGRLQLEKGMRKALSLRASFWDWMWMRAQNPPAEGSR